MPHRNMNKTRSFAISWIMSLALLIPWGYQAQTPPANDMFSNSQVIVPTWNPNQTDASGSITAVRPAWSYFGEANLIGATTEAGEPNHASANGIASVWYKYTPSTSGEMRIITTNGSTLVAGSTAFAVYTGGLNGPISLLKETASTAWGLR